MSWEADGPYAYCFGDPTEDPRKSRATSGQVRCTYSAYKRTLELVAGKPAVRDLGRCKVETTSEDQSNVMTMEPFETDQTSSRPEEW